MTSQHFRYIYYVVLSTLSHPPTQTGCCGFLPVLQVQHLPRPAGYSLWSPVSDSRLMWTNRSVTQSAVCAEWVLAVSVGTSTDIPGVSLKPSIHLCINGAFKRHHHRYWLFTGTSTDVLQITERLSHLPTKTRFHHLLSTDIQRLTYLSKLLESNCADRIKTAMFSKRLINIHMWRT